MTKKPDQPAEQPAEQPADQMGYQLGQPVTASPVAYRDPAFAESFIVYPVGTVICVRGDLAAAILGNIPVRVEPEHHDGATLATLTRAAGITTADLTRA